MIFKYPSGGSADYYCQELGLWFPSEIISNNPMSSSSSSFSSSSKIKHEHEPEKNEKKQEEENKSMDVEKEKEGEGETKYTHKIELVYSIGNDLNGHLIKRTAVVFYPTDRSTYK